MVAFEMFKFFGKILFAKNVHGFNYYRAVDVAFVAVVN